MAKDRSSQTITRLRGQIKRLRTQASDWKQLGKAMGKQWEALNREKTRLQRLLKATINDGFSAKQELTFFRKHLGMKMNVTSIDDNTIKAPWTPTQVLGLNGYQTKSGWHPFTCGNNRHSEAHVAYQAKHGGDFGQLVATADGWICPVCNYKQDWAHKFMVDGWAELDEKFRGVFPANTGE